MSKDLSNLNTISSKLNIKLYDANNTLVPTIWSLNLKNYQILFEGLTNILSASSYTIEIYGLKTPSTIEQDLISIIYLRTIHPIPSTTTRPLPRRSHHWLTKLTPITMSPYFNT